MAGPWTFISRPRPERVTLFSTCYNSFDFLEAWELNAGFDP